MARRYISEKVRAALDGLPERQAARRRRRARLYESMARRLAEPLPLHSPALVALGRGAEKVTPTIETPRTHETHTEIVEAKRVVKAKRRRA